jgi:hypothetical protein
MPYTAMIQTAQLQAVNPVTPLRNYGRTRLKLQGRDGTSRKQRYADRKTPPHGPSFIPSMHEQLRASSIAFWSSGSGRVESLPPIPSPSPCFSSPPGSLDASAAAAGGSAGGAPPSARAPVVDQAAAHAPANPLASDTCGRDQPQCSRAACRGTATGAAHPPPAVQRARRRPRAAVERNTSTRMDMDTRMDMGTDKEGADSHRDVAAQGRLVADPGRRRSCLIQDKLLQDTRLLSVSRVRVSSSLLVGVSTSERAKYRKLLESPISRYRASQGLHNDHPRV